MPDIAPLQNRILRLCKTVISKFQDLIYVMSQQHDTFLHSITYSLTYFFTAALSFTRSYHRAPWSHKKLPHSIRFFYTLPPIPLYCLIYSLTHSLTAAFSFTRFCHGVPWFRGNYHIPLSSFTHSLKLPYFLICYLAYSLTYSLTAALSFTRSIELAESTKHTAEINVSHAVPHCRPWCT